MPVRKVNRQQLLAEGRKVPDRTRGREVHLLLEVRLLPVLLLLLALRHRAVLAPERLQGSQRAIYACYILSTRDGADNKITVEYRDISRPQISRKPENGRLGSETSAFLC